ncbi:MAG: hypothetical protein HZB85_00845 [Deltaproteobacteria bacterium]|nr:hypothetical protein [Deltaproteobacteria bacterium]
MIDTGIVERGENSVTDAAAGACRRRFYAIAIAAAMFLLQVVFFAVAPVSRAETACSKVSLEILQEATVERVAFDAKLVLTNNMPDKDLAELRVDVSIKDADGNIRNDVFFIKTSAMQNISGVDGTGIVKAGTAAEAHWLIIPSPGAGGQTAIGLPYWVGATITYAIAGKQEVVPVNPDKITVKPMPQIILDYFMPFNVLGDNPFTPQVEAPVPFPLAVRVLNDGYGAALNFKIDSAQPKITSNDQGLLVDFKLLGSQVNDSSVSPALTVQFGDLGSKKAGTAYWEMISTLSGRFEKFDVSFSHSSELGGELTSLIKETNAYYLARRIKVNLPGRDNKLDYLADTDKDAEHLPDAIYESEIPNGSKNRDDARAPVHVETPVSTPSRPTPQSSAVSMTVTTVNTGWVYVKLPDPSQGMLKLLDVVRGDGVHLDSNNFWVERGLDRDYQTQFTLQFVDYRGDSSVTGAYTLQFTQPDADLAPPSSRVVFDGPAVSAADRVYITPLTRVILTSTDNDGGSGVDQMFDKVVGVDAGFEPFYPFRLTSPKQYAMEYYSVDRSGNTEAAKTLVIVVDDAPPQIQSFGVSPAGFVPYAPKGVAAAHSVTFTAVISDNVTELPVTINIKDSGAAPKVVRTLTGTALSGEIFTAEWDGRDNSGKLAATGTYTAELRVSDGLNDAVNTGAVSHTATATATVEALEWFTGAPVDPNPSGAQMYPKVSGATVVWQDNRGGNWDVYVKDLSGGVSRAVVTNGFEQTMPDIDGNIVVWQDNRSGDWDIYGYDLPTNREFSIATGPGNQVHPAISGNWVVWQSDQSANWDIYAGNLTTGEKVRITSHERDQINPAISGNAIVWEDYRNGLGEIFKYEVVSGTETRVTVDINNQIKPGVSGQALVWTDQRNGGSQKDIYANTPATGETRVTYGSYDESDAAIFNDTVVYVDYEKGPADPDLSFYDLQTGVGGKLSADPARQEEPAISSSHVLWQDNRDGVYQIYKAAFKIEAAPLEVELAPGFNLVAAGAALAAAYPNASDLLASGGDIEKVLSYDSLHGTYMDASNAGGNFSISKGMGLVIYARQARTLKVADAGDTVLYTLLQGENQIGILKAPADYRAQSLVNSVGVDNIQGVRRFDISTGAWQTAVVRDNAGVKELVGVNFPITAGDGLIITMKKRVDGWKP